MTRSMTGFGRHTADGYTVELRSVNHRFAEVAVRLPRELAPLEERLRRLILSEVKRGRVDTYVTADRSGAPATAPQIDKPLAQAYDTALKELAAVLGVPRQQPDLALLVSLPGVVSQQEAAVDAEAAWPHLEAAARGALAGLVAMREAEGAALAADLVATAAELEAHVAGIAARAPEVAAELRTRLERRLAELLPAAAVDPLRVTMEVAMLAERAAIDEELARVGSHLDQLRAALAQTGAVGRKLEFILQELGREVNTIGSKAGDAGVAALVVEAKGSLEKLREQVQNVE